MKLVISILIGSEMGIYLSPDFMFELRGQEFTNLSSQVVTSSLSEWGGRLYKPMALRQKGTPRTEETDWISFEKAA
jgi:hypothetical protein